MTLHISLHLSKSRLAMFADISYQILTDDGCFLITCILGGHHNLCCISTTNQIFSSILSHFYFYYYKQLGEMSLKEQIWLDHTTLYKKFKNEPWSVEDWYEWQRTCQVLTWHDNQSHKWMLSVYSIFTINFIVSCDIFSWYLYVYKMLHIYAKIWCTISSWEVE